MRPRGTELSAEFFQQLRQHLSSGVGISKCAQALNKTAATFDAYIREAFQQGYLTLRPKVNDEISSLLNDFIKEKYGLTVKAVVAAGDPDSSMFASLAAENLLLELRSLFEDDSKKIITLLIISGSTTGELVTECVNSSLWEEIIRPSLIQPHDKEIRLVAGNITPIYGDELYGNALVSVVLLSRFIASKLPNYKVIPYGLVAPLVVDKKGRKEIDSTINKEILKIVDPRRLEGRDDQNDLPINTQVNMVVSGIGSFDRAKNDRKQSTSVFQWAVNEENLEVDENLVGDVGFYGINREGSPVPLYRHNKKDGKKEEVFIYSVSSPGLMKSLVSNGGKVLLVARSKRLFGKVRVHKTDVAIASLKGKLGNIIVTDLITAQNILKTDIACTKKIINSQTTSKFDQRNLLFLANEK